jgi:hypothetical protein
MDSEKRVRELHEFFVNAQKHPAITLHSFERHNGFDPRRNLMAPVSEVFYAIKIPEGYREMEVWIWDIDQAIAILGPSRDI